MNSALTFSDHSTRRQGDRLPVMQVARSGAPAAGANLRLAPRRAAEERFFIETRNRALIDSFCHRINEQARIVSGHMPLILHSIGRDHQLLPQAAKFGLCRATRDSGIEGNVGAGLQSVENLVERCGQSYERTAQGH